MSDCCYFIETDAKKLRRFEIARKVAFMMAWHPRLGADAPIRQYVSKDVGKLIANCYISTISRSEKALLMRKPSPNVMIGVLNDSQRKKRDTDNFKLIEFSMINHTLMTHQKFFIQTPVMRLPFGATKYQPEIAARWQNQVHSLRLELAQPLQDLWFVEWIKDLEKSMIRGVSMICPGQNDTASRFHSVLKSDKFDSATLRVRVPNEDKKGSVYVFDSRMNHIGNFQEKLDEGWFESGAEIRAILRHVGVWQKDNFFYNQFMLEQVHVIKSAQEVKKERYCSFILDKDDEEFRAK